MSDSLFSQGLTCVVLTLGNRVDPALDPPELPAELFAGARTLVEIAPKALLQRLTKR